MVLLMKHPNHLMLKQYILILHRYNLKDMEFKELQLYVIKMLYYKNKQHQLINQLMLFQP